MEALQAGGWILSSPETHENGPGAGTRSKMLTRIGIPAACLTVGLLLWTVMGQAPAESPAPLHNGMGGPAEDTPAAADAAAPGEAGHPAAAPSDLSGSLVRSQPQRDLATWELGPVFQPDEGPQPMTIGRGQTFYEALAARGVAHEDIMTLVKAVKPFRNLRSVKRGEIFQVHVASDGGLRSLRFDLDDESYVTWVRDGDTYERVDGTYPVEYRLRGVGGTIDVSLYSSLEKVGAPLSLAPKMSDILGWDVDFKRDLRQGDTFRILYEEVWKDGKLIRTGAIQALELHNRGKARQAFLFETADGKTSYYDGEGNNMQKQLLRAPLRYSRISSGFSNRRLHPVLKRYMPHHGVDYAAPLGTPVKAGGDGVVVAATTKQGNGRYVQIRHSNSEYETFYLHLSGFAKGVRVGTRVTQGQVIGYVGATGYATGPHLDYRVKRNGKFVDPRKLKLPAAAPVADAVRPVFAAQADAMASALAELPLDASVPVPPLNLARPDVRDGSSMAGGAPPAAVKTAN
jgi:murein DD-endopeptidase MepM/ murein hydrolase activator NlpD